MAPAGSLQVTIVDGAAVPPLPLPVQAPAPAPEPAQAAAGDVDNEVVMSPSSSGMSALHYYHHVYLYIRGDDHRPPTTSWSELSIAVAGFLHCSLETVNSMSSGELLALLQEQERHEEGHAGTLPPPSGHLASAGAPLAANDQEQVQANGPDDLRLGSHWQHQQ